MSYICVPLHIFFHACIGFEETIGTNHVGHFYLAQLLAENLEKTSTREENSRYVCYIYIYIYIHIYIYVHIDVYVCIHVCIH
jgi:hypothetical protein